ncbi:MAG: hypothetical protein INR69_00505 [Mucilaginibacter polytrichastri]|nr:hypothetical protein [Mucilaginibacter polytrichastri]
MKTLLFSALIAAGVTCHAQADDHRHKTKTAEVPEFIRNQFAEDFPSAQNVHWKASAGYNEARADIDRQPMSVFYDTEGEQMGTTRNVQLSDLPKAGREDIQKKYAQAVIGEIIKYTDNPENDHDVYDLNDGRTTDVNYFVEIENNGKDFILKVNDYGEVSYFDKAPR